MAIRLEDLLASSRRHLRTAAKAPRTIELYSRSVRHFSRWLTERDRSATLEELTWHAISAWLAEIAEPSTVGTRLRGMRRFCRWPVTEGELEVAPTDGIEIPRPARRLRPQRLPRPSQRGRAAAGYRGAGGCPGCAGSS